MSSANCWHCCPTRKWALAAHWLGWPVSGGGAVVVVDGDGCGFGDVGHPHAPPHWD